MTDASFPIVLGPFHLWPPSEGAPAWCVSWEGSWLPGSYADERAVMLMCGIFLGAEDKDFVMNEVMSALEVAHNHARPSEDITVEHILKLWNRG